MLAFIPWPCKKNLVNNLFPWIRDRLRCLPAFGEWVWQASPTMNTRSCIENWEATRCPTGNKNAIRHILHVLTKSTYCCISSTNQNCLGCPAYTGIRTSWRPIAVWKLSYWRYHWFGTHLKQLLWTYLTAVHAASWRIDNILIGQLNVDSYLVALTRDNHTRSVVRVDGRPISNIRKISVGCQVHHAP